ncbi:MAG TPA: peptidylprolyl isomerase [Terriglobales bacterium]|nr:peptidylprolyl isomerase [Terriglobales bacterium]
MGRAEDHGGQAVAAHKPSHLSPATPVITINGVCEAPKTGAPAPKSGCTTVITRAEFEKLADSLQPNMPPQVRQQLAMQYPQILFMSQQARKRGLEQNPHYLQVLKFTKMELLRAELESSLQEEAGKIPQSEVKDFYQNNASNFEQTTFLRVFIPKTRQADTPKDGATAADSDAVQKTSETDMKSVAEDLHTRAVAGEDFDKLQKEAYEAVGVKAAPPPTLNANVRRDSVPGPQSPVFELRPGDLSGLLNDPTGYYFFKVVSKTMLPLAQAQDEIRDTLRNQRLQALHQAMMKSVSADLNSDYFGDAPTTPGTAGGPRPAPSDRTSPMSPPQSTQPKE